MPYITSDQNLQLFENLYKQYKSETIGKEEYRDSFVYWIGENSLVSESRVHRDAHGFLYTIDFDNDEDKARFILEWA